MIFKKNKYKLLVIIKDCYYKGIVIFYTFLEEISDVAY